jgi:hypothetical protein
MNYLGGLVCCGGQRRWVLGHMPLKGCVLRIYCSGWPLRIKEINVASMIKVLPVQPYDIIGSVLIE